MTGSAFFLAALTLLLSAISAGAADALTLERDGNWLTVHSRGGEIRINYLEAYCRAGSTDADWVKHTVIHAHKRDALRSARDGRCCICATRSPTA